MPRPHFSQKPVLVDIPSTHYLAIAGHGQPGGPEFQDAISALYPMAYTIKMTRKSGGQETFPVAPLEGIYTAITDWQLLLPVPPAIRKSEVRQTAGKLLAKGKPESIQRVDLVTRKEGRCLQALHVGPYDQVAKTIAVLKEYADANGLELIGPHHEIYLSDPRRTAPERLKTLVRYPVRSAAPATRPS
ncbi:GyrI-like domain-containing protein [uncultured Paludibaculum sp.]|uniref:GyrI-like domain-containing protein n=1 Tax=uncultured Paludibaculum sp. TaxID=1765020 RepID=UPI002AAB4C08|nr:GyrI-like domain-containing protein [uncultured Paludibaculum sp.]